MNRATQSPPSPSAKRAPWGISQRLVGTVPIASLAVAACVTALTLPAERANAATGDTNAQAVQRGVDFLVPDVVQFTDQNGCIACHRQGAALYGLSLAKGAGFDVSMIPATGAPHIAQAIANDEQQAGYWDWSGPNLLKTSYNFYGLAGYDAYMSTAFSNNLVSGADWAVSVQQSDGRWPMDFDDGYTAHGDIPYTARFMVGIAQAVQRVDANKAATYKAALAKAAAYITAHQSDTNDVTGVGNDYEISWAIIGLKAAGLPDNDPTVVALVAALQANQSSLGYAWGEQPGWAPDAFNSGMAIYAQCKAGVDAIGNTSLQQSLQWVNSQQGADGTWGSDVATTFAILGLSCYGDYGVIVSNSGPLTKVISSHSPNPQTATYNFDIQNHGFINDTYNLSVVGGMPGWSGTIQGTVVINAGAHATVMLTVQAPANLPEALPVEMAVVATSQAVPTLSSSARITTFTDPPPPTSGDSTSVTLTAGNGTSVSLGQTQTLSATVHDSTANSSVVGPGKGVVTFFVAGLAIATDTDADGDGVYTVPFKPDCAWNLLGPQDFRAIYSGIDLPVGSDLLSSLSAGTMTLVQPACCAKTEICNGVDDDCDGVADNGNPGGGGICTTGSAGICAVGALTCTNGGEVCVGTATPGQHAESCNGLDDDCDGSVDNGFHVGEACTVGTGACAATGTLGCTQGGQAACSAQPGSPSTEICGDAIDSDCDGNPNNGCACLDDSACGGSASGQICDTGAGGTFTCVLGCHGTGGNTCATGLQCTSSDATRGQCVACLQDGDCGAQESGIVCDQSSKSCVAGCRATGGNGCANTLSCTSTDASIGHCVACQDDSECGDPASGIVCSGNTCVAGCRKTGGNTCGASLTCTSADSSVGHCIGCSADADCGAPDSGIACDAGTNSCVGGCRGTGGNGCPSGMTCSSQTDGLGLCAISETSTSSSTSSSSSSSSTGSSAGPGTFIEGLHATLTDTTGGSGGASSTTGSGDNSANNDNASGSTPGSSSSSCSCSMQPSSDESGLAWVVTGAVGVMVSRRRRQRIA